jgi:putative RNA 2'-phosphotransferase
LKEEKECYLGNIVMNDQERKKVSKFISLVLRHKPGDLELDSRGCCLLDDLLELVNDKMKFEVTRDNIIELTRPFEDSNVKTRFELEGEFIRAGHGHSIPIEGYEEVMPDKPLYHATPRQAVELIKKSGLRAMNRQKVHLSYDKDITVEAARRRSKDVVLIEIVTSHARFNGVKFYKSADSRIILSDNVPFECLKLGDVK